jgi:hypothetical protein
LASYIHFKSRECLDQAVLVAKNNSIDFAKVKKWCGEEKAVYAFEDFLSEFKK